MSGIWPFARDALSLLLRSGLRQPRNAGILPAAVPLAEGRQFQQPPPRWVELKAVESPRLFYLRYLFTYRLNLCCTQVCYLGSSLGAQGHARDVDVLVRHPGRRHEWSAGHQPQYPHARYTGFGDIRFWHRSAVGLVAAHRLDEPRRETARRRRFLPTVQEAGSVPTSCAPMRTSPQTRGSRWQIALPTSANFE